LPEDRLLVAAEPREFFNRYLNRSGPIADMAFPLSGIWRRLSGSSQKTLGPFQFLFTAAALVAVVNGLHAAIWYHFGMGQYAGAGAHAFRSSTGMALHRVDLEHLTGVSLVDGLIHQIVDLLYFGFLAAAVSLALIRSRVTHAQLLHYYAYGKGASLALLAAASVAGLGIFATMNRYWLQGAVIGETLCEVAGNATSLYFLFVLPIYLFPQIFGVSERKIRVAVMTGAIAWLTVNGVLRFGLLARYGVLVSFQ